MIEGPIEKLDEADAALANFDADYGEAFESAVAAARSAINAARAIARDQRGGAS